MTPGFVCPDCRGTALMIVASMELPPDGRSDEITVQVVRCAACRLIGVAAYEESRRGDLTSEAWTHLGYRLPELLAMELLSLIRSCPAPASISCTCTAHQEIGRVAGAHWAGVARWGASVPFSMVLASA